MVSKRAWAEIDKAALANNMQEVRKVTKAKIIAMVKANGYGHGGVSVSEIFLQNGADALGVACVGEASQLRQANIKAPILIVGSVPTPELKDAILADAILTVSSYEEACKINDAASKLGKIAPVHIKVDTGMTRLGFSVKDVDLASQIFAMPHIRPEGVFTHMACADDAEEEPTNIQFAAFSRFADALPGGTLMRHVCNSASLYRFPSMHQDAVRPGICLYGNAPMPGMGDLHLKEAMSLRATIARVAEIPEGTKIGYGGTFTATRSMVVATILIGYGDGVARALSNRGEVIIKGKRVPIIGRICMDQMMVDVTGLDVYAGEIATIRGRADGNEITTEETAKLLNTISYEIYCTVGERIPRIYV